MMRNHFTLLSVLAAGAWALLFSQQASRGETAGSFTEIIDRIQPIDGGWSLRLNSDPTVPRPEYGTAIGVTRPQSHLTNQETRRLLFPPADRSLIWTPDELKKLELSPFRPFVLAYGRPRFALEFHSAGGVLGHLYAGLAVEGGTSKWFHRWSDIDIRYVDGRMDYTLWDKDFPGTTVLLSAAALEESAGVVIRIEVNGAPDHASLVWGYGGASAFYTLKDIGQFSDAVGPSALATHGDIPSGWEFSPMDCSKDLICWRNDIVTLERVFDKSDAYVSAQAAAAVHQMPSWKGVVQGGSAWNVVKSKCGFGDPDRFITTPGELLQTAQWVAQKQYVEKRNTVAVQQIPLGKRKVSGFIAVGMGRNIAAAVTNPSRAYSAALRRNRSIAERIVTHTPDSHLDSAMTTMAFATDGCWGDLAMVHGGWSWRLPYLGWRILYGPSVYGWTNRVKHTIQNHVRFSRIETGPNRGGLGHIIEQKPVIYYNMNEVFLDMTRHYFDYTGDLDLMREVFPVLREVVEWEDRRLQPENAHLYENALNTWISDSHWYIRGQCTQASAYQFNAYTFLAELAQRLDQDPEPFRQKARSIREAMQRKLWMDRKGVFAEYQDTIGNRLLHPEPELATIYHAAEFGAADSLQIYQMLRWVDANIRSETTPNGGKMIWSSNWFPNNGRSYTHSTHELAYAEVLNLALANYLAGRTEEAYSLIRGVLCGIYSNPAPGSLSCHANTNGTQRRNLEFADSISMWGRTVVEGMFGIVPKRMEGKVLLTPQLPAAWPRASIKTPLFAYNYSKQSGKVDIKWSSPVATSVHLKLPLRAKAIEAVYVNNNRVSYEEEAGVGLTWLSISTVSSKGGKIQVRFTPMQLAAPEVIAVKNGDAIKMPLSKYHASNWLDPQSILKEATIQNGILHGRVDCEPGPGLLFLKTDRSSCPMLLPLALRVESTEPRTVQIWKSPDVPDRDLNRWALVDLSDTFNSSVTDVLDRILRTAVPPPYPASDVGFSYRQLHFAGRQNPKVSDGTWRKKIGDDGIGWTTDGIPFKSPRSGNNIAVVSLMGGFPERLKFKASTTGKFLFLMISGITFPNQSHVVNLRITLHYADGSKDVRDLRSPFDIGDCWSNFLGRFHDTAANGFENLGGRSGPAGSKEVEDMTKPVAVDTEAHLVQFRLKPAVPLSLIECEAIANDTAFGIMGATVLVE